MLVQCKVKVRCQFSDCIIQPKVKQFGAQVDYIPTRPAGETVVVVIRHIQNWIIVIVKQRQRHALVVDIDSVHLCCFLYVDTGFHYLKKFI